MSGLHALVHLSLHPRADGRDAEAARSRLRASVLLRTCERCEIVGVVGPGATLGVAPLISRTGDAAARHVLRVAAGLESRIPGEPHVLGQVRSAFAAATETGQSCALLDALGRRAARAGRVVRSSTPLGRIAESYVTRTIDHAASWCAAQGLRAPRVGVLGSGAMARDVRAATLAVFDAEPIAIARHPERAIDAGFRRVRPLERLRETFAVLDVLIAAASSPIPLLRAADCDTALPRLLIDLGEPPVTEHACALRPGVTRLSLVDLARGAAGLCAEVRAQAEGVVERQLDLLRREIAARAEHAGA